MPVLSNPVDPPKQALANLRAIHLQLLMSHDETEEARLLSLAEKIGFFYLDLTDAGSSGMLNTVAGVKDIMQQWFQSDVEEKMQATPISNSHGYKPVGTHAGAGTAKDGFECLRIGQQQMRARWALPPVVKQNIILFDEFVSGSNYVLQILLDRLSASLGLRGTKSLRAYHCEDKPSNSAAVFNRYPAREDGGANVGQNMHTDLGTLTLLFTDQWGLQVLCPATGSSALEEESLEWRYVEPRPGHAVINVGDTLRFVTGRRLRSALHRALPIHNIDRYSIGYFLRANDESEFVDSDGRKASAMGWFEKKFATFEKPQELQNQESVLLGGLVDGAQVDVAIV